MYFLTLYRNSEQIIGSKFRRYVTFDTAKEIYTRYVNRKIHVRLLTVTGNAYTNF